MYCPFCGHIETKVTDSRLASEGAQIRRRRECLKCGERFTTFETAELVMPTVVKGDKTRQPFDEAKLRAGMAGALHKRPVSGEAIDEAVSRIGHKIRGLGEREVQSRVIGEIVRFASVYRHFQDVDAFHKEIERLREHPRRRKPARDRVEERDQLPLLPDPVKK
jgi:transcriptional repressor NrdR